MKLETVRLQLIPLNEAHPDFASEEKEKPSCREGFSLYL